MLPSRRHTHSIVHSLTCIISHIYKNTQHHIHPHTQTHIYKPAPSHTHLMGEVCCYGCWGCFPVLPVCISNALHIFSYMVTHIPSHTLIHIHICTLYLHYMHIQHTCLSYLCRCNIPTLLPDKLLILQDPSQKRPPHSVPFPSVSLDFVNPLNTLS